VPPFQGDSPVAVAYQHVRENPVAPSARNPEVPRAIDSIVMKALAKNQLNRYQSAGEMRADLQRALANQPVVAEAVMTDAERTQFIARTPPPVVGIRRTDYVEEEDESRRTGLIWAAIVLALLLVIGVGTFLIFGTGSNKAAETVEIPNVTGQLPAAAENQLKGLGFAPVKGADYGGACAGNISVEKGHVCITEPAAGNRIKKGATVTYRLYSPKTVQVPFVEGGTFGKAIDALHAVGLNGKQKAVYSTDPKGTVIHQETQQFTLVPPGTVIVLDVSTGTLKLPDVRGQKIDAARATLDGAQFTNRTEVSKNTTIPSKDGTVADESPTPQIAYPISQKITLTVYKYAPPAPTCTTPAPTPSPTPITTTPPGGLPTIITPPPASSSTPAPGSSSTGLPPCK
jgi:serine/threonine-protein kinase